MNITTNGLKIIGLLVAILWGCVMMERALLREARVERAHVMQQLRRLKDMPASPASAPHQFPWSGDASHRTES